jgi:hypothetical protein
VAAGAAAGAAEAAAGAGDSLGGSRPAEPELGEPGKPPPAGWQIPEEPGAGARDPDPFVALAQALRDIVPPDLQRRLVAAIRELLLALRALIDWYLERMERRREQSVEVQDIPIL